MSKELLRVLVTVSSEAPMNMFSKILAEIIYGGKMSDERDEILTEDLVTDYININYIRENDFQICGVYNLPENL